jgi:hypothetical protein
LQHDCVITLVLIINDVKTKKSINSVSFLHYKSFLQDEINMAEIDDFEIINETGLSNEQAFELIDVNDDITEKNTNINTPTTDDIVLPLLIPKPLVDETSQVVQQQQQQQQTSCPIVNSSKPEEPHSPVKTTISMIPLVPTKRTIQLPSPPPGTFAPVPPLPKAPPLRRYGGAALIPHNLDMSLDINTVIDKSRQNQQNTLNASIQQQQQQQRDIQLALEQRRKLLNKK